MDKLASASQIYSSNSINGTLEDYMNKISVMNNINTVEINSNRDLEGYNIYRDGNFLDFVTTSSYNDTNVTIGL